LEVFSKQTSGGGNERLTELEKQLVEKDIELQQTANSFKILSQKYVDAVKQLDTKNKQNLDIMKASTLQEKKILGIEEEKNKVKSTLEKQLSAADKELQRLKDEMRKNGINSPSSIQEI